MSGSRKLVTVILLSLAFLSVLNASGSTQAALVSAITQVTQAKAPNAISLAQTANSTASSTQSTPISSQTVTTPTSSLPIQSITVTSISTATSVTTATTVSTTTSVATTTSTSLAATTSSVSSTVSTSTTTTQTSAVVSPEITLSPSSASTGATVDVTGSGFSTSDSSCSISGGAVASQTCTISSGVLGGAFTIASNSGGAYTITATGSPAGDTASASIIVTTVPPSLTLSPSSGSEGATVDVSGSDFLTSDSSCQISGTPVTSETCSVSSGTVTGAFTVAAADAGTYTISVVGSPGSDSASASFIVLTGTTPSATLSSSSATAGSTVDISGTGFSTSDTSCSVSSDAASSSTCAISDGVFSASFVVANVAASDYTVTVTGLPTEDSASATLTVQTGPQMTLDPTESQAGTTVDVSGSGFNTADYSCSLTGTSVASESCSITDGALTGSFTVADVAASSYTITATAGPEGDSASATFTLGTPAGAITESISLNPTSAKVSASVSVTGSGFSTSDTSCTLSGTVVGTPSCTISGGSLTASFVVASLSPGSYLVTATGSPESDSASVYFTLLSSSLTVTLNATSAVVGANVQVSGTGYSTSDTSCSLSGTAVTSSSCSISNGGLTGSFTVSNVSPGSYTVTATGSPIADYGSATLDVVAATATTTSAIPDFSISAAPSVALPQGQSISVPVTLTSLNGFSSSVTMTAAWVGTIPTGVNISIATPIALASGGAATSTLSVNAASNAPAGSFTVQVGGASGSLSHTTTVTVVIQSVTVVTVTSSTTASNMTSSSTSQTSTTTPAVSLNCPVSSAISGSALALPAQTLRSFRDQSILRTKTGADFMILFNSWYYSFSPAIAAHIGTHPTQRILFRDALYPLFGILYASYYTYLQLSPVNGEVAAAMAGVVAASLIGLVYLAPLCWVCSRLLRRRFRFSRLTARRLVVWLVVSVGLVGLAFSTGAVVPLGLAATSLVLCSLAFGCMAGVSGMARAEVWLSSVVAIVQPLDAIRMALSSARSAVSRSIQSLGFINRRR